MCIQQFPCQKIIVTPKAFNVDNPVQAPLPPKGVCTGLSTFKSIRTY